MYAIYAYIGVGLYGMTIYSTDKIDHILSLYIEKKWYI